MSAVDKVKALCRERKIAVSRLERDCGFANGYIGRLKKGSFPNDRLQKIADYFGVSISYLMDDVKESEHQADYNGYYLNDETAKVAQEIFEDRDLRILFDAARDSSPDDLRMAADLLRRLKGDR